MGKNLAKWAAGKDASDKEEKKPKAGSGKRFEELSDELADKGAEDPDALAATIGRKKFGSEKMSKWAAAGRKKA